MVFKITNCVLFLVLLFTIDGKKFNTQPVIYLLTESVPEHVMNSRTSGTGYKEVEVTPEETLDDGYKGCGWIENWNQGIQNGSGFTKIRKLPWQVSIYWVTHGKNGQELEIYDNCAGTLIHPRVVLTQPKYDDISNLKQLRVKAGDWNLPKETFVPQFSNVESVAKIETRWFDVDLLFLASPIERSAHINYACLPNPGLVTDVSTNCFMEADHNYMGVAHGKRTKMLDVSSMDLEDCRTKIRESQFLWTDRKLNSSWICVSNIEGHQNPCEGTDGTPLACPYKDSPGRFYHAGVMSWYSSCYFGDGYGIFKTVAHARELIDKKIQEKGYSTNTYTP